MLDDFLRTRSLTRPSRGGVSAKAALAKRTLASEARLIAAGKTIRLHDESGASMFEIMKSELADSHTVVFADDDPYRAPEEDAEDWIRGQPCDMMHRMPTLSKAVNFNFYRRIGKISDWTPAADTEANKMMISGMRRVVNVSTFKGFRHRVHNPDSELDPAFAQVKEDVDSDFPVPTRTMWHVACEIQRSTSSGSFTPVLVLLVEHGDDVAATPQPAQDGIGGDYQEGPFSQSVVVEVVKAYCPCTSGCMCGHIAALMTMLELGTDAFKKLAAGGSVDDLKQGPSCTAVLCRWIFPTVGEVADVTKPLYEQQFGRTLPEEGDEDGPRPKSAITASQRPLFVPMVHDEVNLGAEEEEEALHALLDSLRQAHNGEPSALEVQWYPNYTGDGQTVTKKRMPSDTSKKKEKKARLEQKQPSKKQGNSRKQQQQPNKRQKPGTASRAASKAKQEEWYGSVPGLLGGTRRHLYCHNIHEVHNLFVGRLRLYRNGTCNANDFYPNALHVPQTQQRRNPSFDKVKPSITGNDGQEVNPKTILVATGVQLDGVLLESLRAHAAIGAGAPERDGFVGIDRRTQTGRLRSDKSRTIEILLNSGGTGAFPFNINGNHWVVLLICGRRRYVGYFDSLAGEISSQLQECVITAISTLPNSTTWKYEWNLGAINGRQFQHDPDPPGPFQCGVWALYCEEIWLRFLQTDSQSFFSFLHGQIIHEVKTNYFDLISDKRQEYKSMLE